MRGLDLNQRPLGYEPNELPGCSTPHFHLIKLMDGGQSSGKRAPAQRQVILEGISKRNRKTELNRLARLNDAFNSPAQRVYFTSVASSSGSPSTAMRSERRKCRSLGVKVPTSPPASPRPLPRRRSSRVHFIQPDRGFKHQQHIESMLADVLHHAGNLFALNDRLMDGLAQLLDQFTQTGCHSYLHDREHDRHTRGRAMRVATRNLLTLLPFRIESNSRIRIASNP